MEETIKKLRQLADIPIMNAFKSQKSIFDPPVLKTSSDKIKQVEEKQKRESTGAARNRMVANEYPFFEVSGVFIERTVPEDRKYVVYVDNYEPPPLGISEKDDFNPLVHLEIESEDELDENPVEEFAMQEEETYNDSNALKKPATFIKGLCKLWLKAEPDGDRFS